MDRMMLIKISLVIFGVTLLMYAAATEGIQLLACIIGGSLIGVGMALE